MEVLNSGYSVFVGEGAGANASITSVDGYNTLIGHEAGKNVTTGRFNTAIGAGSFISSSTGDNNTGVGFYALRATTGGDNTALGYGSMLSNSSGQRNVGLGSLALRYNSTGNNNVAIGNEAGSANTTSSNNTILGAYAGSNATGAGNVLLGYRAGQNESGDNKLYIDNSNSSSPLIYGEFDTDSVVINGDLRVNGSDQLAIRANGGTTDVGITQNHVGGSSTMEFTTYDGSSQATRLLLRGGSGNADIEFYKGTRGSETRTLFLQASTGNLSIGSNGDGSVGIANAWNTFSDRRWKTDLQVITSALEKVNQINGYYYKWKDRPDTTMQVGVMAQEIEAILPELVSTNEEGYKSVDYSKLTALLIQAMKEQQQMINNQQMEIDHLKASKQQEKAQLNAMDKRLQALEALLTDQAK